jgi:16S rRNA (cytidine1402-2'-O)-methyltransferase
MPAFYVVATPIGNLQDISFRALEVLKEVDLILCEDTRVTRKLLEYYEIKTATLSYHQHSKENKEIRILEFLKEGKNLALVSDAGTPGVSDPGNKLVETIVKEMKEKVEIIPVPGPSAVMAAASISGFQMDRFVFLGFPPAKKKRNKFFDEMASLPFPIIFFESSHRIIKTLEQASFPGRKMVVCRELTKKFEEVYRGDSIRAAEEIKKSPLKGEFVVVLEGNKILRDSCGTELNGTD